MHRQHRYVAIVLALSALAVTPVRAALADPPSAPAHSLSVGGGVERTLEIAADDLRRRPASQIVELQLPGKEGGKPGVVRGVRLRALLDEAKIRTRDHHTVKKLAIVARASDGYAVVFSWSELFNTPVGEGVLVLFERDGKPLAPSEGPLALVSAQDLRTGPRHVKWLKAVEVRQLVD